MAAVRSFEELAVQKGRHSIVTDASKYADELGLQLLLNYPYPVIIADGKEGNAKKAKFKSTRQQEIQLTVSEERRHGKLIKKRWDGDKS